MLLGGLFETCLRGGGREMVGEVRGGQGGEVRWTGLAGAWWMHRIAFIPQEDRCLFYHKALFSMIDNKMGHEWRVNRIERNGGAAAGCRLDIDIPYHS